jgi:hypothetical protein
MLVEPHKKRPFLIILLMYSLIPLQAREIEIVVEDSDLGHPLEGALIRSWDGQGYTCDEAGKALITVPDDRQVVIQGAYPGYESGRLVIPLSGNRFTLGLRLSGIMEHQELVIEASRPGTSETRSGRSVAISDKDLARTAEIGVIEDVMTSIKLLPGVGYTGFFNAMPSIRGGEPSDLTAVFDGFYIERPYHWGGSVSIFDPRMVQSAQLSHGVFSARYGHTISGLLEISSRKPSSTEVELELGLSTSATNLNLSYPLWGKGGIMVMGKVTYWDPFVWLMKQFVDEVQYITVAPYIRSGAFSADYRFTSDLELTAHGFIGGDGVGALYTNDGEEDGLKTKTDMDFTWDNTLGFFITGLTYNPLPFMVLKATAGLGLLQYDLEGTIYYNLIVPYSDDFLNDYGSLLNGQSAYTIDQNQAVAFTNTTRNYQGRLDFDWKLCDSFLFAAGVQELYSQEILEQTFHSILEGKVSDYPLPFPLPPGLDPDNLYVNLPWNRTVDVSNQGLNSSAYTVMECTTPDKSFGVEMGLRLDHFYFIGRDFTIQTSPVFNPRINFDFGILQNKGIVDSLTATVGTGLFSSLNDNLSAIQSSNGIGDFEMKPNRSWTSVLGTKLDFSGGFSFNIEGYFKYVFDRAYTSTTTDTITQIRTTDYWFDGEGRIWGFDFMLQKLESRYWNGWLSYSFNHARYRNPQSNSGYQRDWFYPSFHHFHNLNLILTIKPVQSFHIAVRFGFASGAPKSVVGTITSYPVVVVDEQGNFQQIIQKYKRDSSYSDTERDGFALPLDVKFSFFHFNPLGKGHGEFYVAVENLLWFIESRRRNTSFNSYTGKEDQGSDTASYQLPIPMPSIGFRWSY